MTDIATRIRDAHGPSQLSDADVARGWGDVVERLDIAPARASRRRRRLSGRVVIAVAIAVISLTSVALAQTGAIPRVLGNQDRPADRMHVFENEPDGTTGLSPMARLFSPGNTVMLNGASYDLRQLRSQLTWRHDGVELRLRSAPASGGQVCMFIEVVRRQSMTTCSRTMGLNGHIASTRFGDLRSGTHIAGVTDDRVRRVYIQMPGGRLVRAKVANNAFAAYLRDFHAQPKGMLVYLDDGTKLQLTMNGCPRVPSDTTRIDRRCLRR